MKTTRPGCSLANNKLSTSMRSTNLLATNSALTLRIIWIILTRKLIESLLAHHLATMMSCLEKIDSQSELKSMPITLKKTFCLQSLKGLLTSSTECAWIFGSRSLPQIRSDAKEMTRKATQRVKKSTQAASSSTPRSFPPTAVALQAVVQAASVRLTFQMRKETKWRTILL